MQFTVKIKDPDFAKLSRTLMKDWLEDLPMRKSMVANMNKDERDEFVIKNLFLIYYDDAQQTLDIRDSVIVKKVI